MKFFSQYAASKAIGISPKSSEFTRLWALIKLNYFNSIEEDSPFFEFTYGGKAARFPFGGCDVKFKRGSTNREEGNSELFIGEDYLDLVSELYFNRAPIKTTTPYEQEDGSKKKIEFRAPIEKKKIGALNYNELEERFTHTKSAVAKRLRPVLLAYEHYWIEIKRYEDGQTVKKPNPVYTDSNTGVRIDLRTEFGYYRQDEGGYKNKRFLFINKNKADEIFKDRDTLRDVTQLLTDPKRTREIGYIPVLEFYEKHKDRIKTDYKFIYDCLNSFVKPQLARGIKCNVICGVAFPRDSFLPGKLANQKESIIYLKEDIIEFFLKIPEVRFERGKKDWASPAGMQEELALKLSKIDGNRTVREAKMRPVLHSINEKKLKWMSDVHRMTLGGNEAAGYGQNDCPAIRLNNGAVANPLKIVMHGQTIFTEGDYYKHLIDPSADDILVNMRSDNPIRERLSGDVRRGALAIGREKYLDWQQIAERAVDKLGKEGKSKRPIIVNTVIDMMTEISEDLDRDASSQPRYTQQTRDNCRIDGTLYIHANSIENFVECLANKLEIDFERDDTAIFLKDKESQHAVALKA